MSPRRIEFLFLNLGHFYDHLFILIYATVAALALPEAFGRSYADLIVYATPAFVAFGVFALPAGWLADRWSRSGMMAIFFVGIGLASMLTGLARTPLEVGAGLFLIGIFAAIYHPVGITMVVEGAPERTGVALGINGVWGNMGVAFAAVVAGGLIDLAGWRAAFLVPGAVAAATGLAYLAFLRAHARHRAATGESAAPARAGAARLELARALLVRVFVILVLTTTFGTLIFQAATVTLPKVLDERLAGVASSASAVGAWAFLVFAVASAAQVAVGHLIDRFSIRTVFAVVAGLQVPTYLMVIGVSGVPLIAGSLAFMLLVFGQIPITDALLSRVTVPEIRSRIYATRFVIGFGVAAVALPLVGFLHERTGFDGMFVVLAFAAALVFFAVLAIPRAAAERPMPVTA